MKILGKNRVNRENRWYVEHFNDQYNRLLVLKGSAKGGARQQIEETLEIIANFIFDDEQEKTDIFGALEEEYEMLDGIRNFIYLASPIAESGQIENHSRYISIPRLSDSDFLDIVHGFYKDCTDREIYKSFRANYKRRGELLSMDRLMEIAPSPQSIFLPYGKKTYIRMKRYGVVEDIFDLVHEYGHSIHFSTNFDMKMYENNYLFIEIVSIFFELLCMEHLISFKEFEEATLDYRKRYFNTTVIKGKYALIENDILYFWSELRNQNAKNIIGRLNSELSKYCEGKTIVDMLNMDISMMFIYVVGYVVALEFLDAYKKDKDKGLYLLKKLMRIDWRLPMEEYYRSILDLGIEPNEHLSDYKNYIMTPKR